MKKNIILFLISITFTSCRRNFATFQPSHYETFEQEKSLIYNISEKKSKKESVNSIYENQSKSDLIELPIIEIEANKTVESIKKEESKSAQINKSAKVELKDNSTVNPKKIKKQNRRRDNWWDGINIRLKIGAVLLGIAIIFALLSIEVLAIVFGLVAAYMIIRGLRKMW
jgi:hypothetical protein